MRVRPLLPLLLCLASVRAAAAQTAEPLHAKYETYALGLPVAELTTGFDLEPRSYRIDLDYRTTGLIGMLFSGHQTNRVEGLWEGDRPEPTRFAGDGVWRGEPRETVIDYDHGQPVIRSLLPANDQEREPVPPGLQAHSVDTLSAVAMLMRRVASTGRCESEATTFDGRRAVGVAAHTVGEERLAPSDRSTYAGPALRCDFEGRLLAGFPRDGDQAEMRRPKHGSAWLARVVPGAPPIPVRISFETSWLGSATMYLTEAGSGPRPAR